MSAEDDAKRRIAICDILAEKIADAGKTDPVLRDADAFEIVGALFSITTNIMMQSDLPFPILMVAALLPLITDDEKDAVSTVRAAFEVCRQARAEAKKPEGQPN